MSTTPPKPTIDRIEELIHRRSSTDRKMSYIWMLVPLLPIVLGLAIAVSLIGVIISAVSKLGNAATQTTQASALPIVGAIAAVYAGGIVALFVVLLLGCFAFYNMIERRNAHIRRQQQLFLAIQTYLIGER
jgi:chromate transport protein ChrA